MHCNRAQQQQQQHACTRVAIEGGYFLNFTKYGLQINAGHEVMMDRVWMGETNFDFDHVKLGSRPNATAIQVTPTTTTWNAHAHTALKGRR